MSDLQDQLDELETAEDFFDFFEVPYESQVMASQRLQIMQRLRRVLADLGEAGSADPETLAETYRTALTCIYEECRDGTGRVRRRKLPAADNDAPATSFVPLTAIRGRRGGR